MIVHSLLLVVVGQAGDGTEPSTPVWLLRIAVAAVIAGVVAYLLKLPQRFFMWIRRKKAKRKDKVLVSCRESYGDDIGDRQGEAQDLANIGNTYVRKGEYEQAIGYFVQALGMFIEMGIADGPRQCLVGLRTCYRAMKAQGDSPSSQSSESPSPPPSPARGEGAAVRFIELCVKAGMSEAQTKQLVEKFEQKSK